MRAYAKEVEIASLPFGVRCFLYFVERFLIRTECRKRIADKVCAIRGVCRFEWNRKEKFA